MEEGLFNIIFSGELSEYCDPEEAKRKFGQLFKLPPSKVEAAFQSHRTVLKRAINRKDAEKYQAILEKIGLVVIVEPVNTELQNDQVSTDINASSNNEKNTSVPIQTPDSDKNDESDSLGIDASSLALVEKNDDEKPEAIIYAAVEDLSKVKRLSFSFSGDGFEYFKIWIVNILLTVLTLGIYSAWAKVRTNRYFYANTYIDGNSFDYLAEPITILKGRVIAVVFLLTYIFIGEFYPPLAAVMGLVFIIFLPWLVMRSLKFRLRNSAYRNIRFGFNGGLWEAVKSYSLMFLLLPLTFGLLFPYMMFLQTRYFANNAKYGVDQFTYNVSAREFYRIYLVAFGVVILVAIFAGMFAAANPLLGALIALSGYILVATYLKVELLNLLFDNTCLGAHEFSSSLEIGLYFKLYLINTVGMILTLGLFYPWAKVRIARYRADNLLFMTQGSLDGYVAAQEEDVNALGEEVGDAFDIDIGF